MVKGVGHRHVVLTTPKELWSYFLKDRLLPKVMADAGAEIIKDILFFYRGEGVEPGIILIIQTAGRALNFNPHLHLLTQHFFFEWSTSSMKCSMKCVG